MLMSVRLARKFPLACISPSPFTITAWLFCGGGLRSLQSQMAVAKSWQVCFFAMRSCGGPMLGLAGSCVCVCAFFFPLFVPQVDQVALVRVREKWDMFGGDLI